ncbi:methyltransferase domain-containing protein [Candidatus Microgenomates bacterium]|nr:MAG: methyltransferase domain-containing protein [Candidatus Microgenomates bacterium]
MHDYIFILGNAHDLCREELVGVLKTLGFDFSIQKLYPPQCVQVTVTQPLPEEALIERLGGTVKIAEIIAPTSSLDPQDLIATIRKKRTTWPKTFGLSAFTDKKLPLPKIAAVQKKVLEAEGVATRYVLPREGQELRSIVVQKQAVTEFLIIENNADFIIAETKEVQNSEDWGKRDYDRPFVDPGIGMLPPKVARMLVNIAVAAISYQSSAIRQEKLGQNSSKGFTILDPFCGMGTVVAEALMIGTHVVASDIAAEMVNKSRKNIEWLKSAYPKTQDLESRFLVSDAVHVSDQLKKNTMDAVVTEPFMGALFEKKGAQLYQKNKLVTLSHIKNTIKGLEKLFIGCFKNWYQVLKPEGVIVITLPEITIAHHTIFVKSVIDNCEKLGYTPVIGPLTYARPEAVVRRQVYVFKKIFNS